MNFDIVVERKRHVVWEKTTIPECSLDLLLEKGKIDNFVRQSF